jgi:PHD/YefM family antitoxin component YafN of YafNO toxin-antitoxin module
METATIRIPEEKKNLLKAAASLENRKMNDVVIDLIDEYIERRKETMELLAIPGLLRTVRAASREFREGKGVPLKDAEAFLDRRILKGLSKGSRQVGKARTITNKERHKTSRST